MKKTILFLGHKPIGEQCFKYLLKEQEEDLKIATVVTNLDKDNWWKSNKIYTLAKKLNIPIISNKTRATNEIIKAIKKYNINTIISAQSPWIIESQILQMVNYFAFNLHNAKLPDYRGHNITSHAILNGNKVYTTTLHWISDKVDCGNIIAERTIDITSTDTAKSIYNKSQKESFKLFKQLLQYFKSDSLPIGTPLSNNLGKFYKKDLLNKHREIKNINEFDVKSRAFYFPPFEPSFLIVNNKKFYILPKEFFNEG